MRRPDGMLQTLPLLKETALTLCLAQCTLSDGPVTFILDSRATDGGGDGGGSSSSLSAAAGGD